jgi:hypothetical protein
VFMSFIREKEIPTGSGNYYAYRVETYREDGKVKQNQTYLGKAGSTAAKEAAKELDTTSKSKNDRDSHKSKTGKNPDHQLQKVEEALTEYPVEIERSSDNPYLISIDCEDDGFFNGVETTDELRETIFDNIDRKSGYVMFELVAPGHWVLRDNTKNPDTKSWGELQEKYDPLSSDSMASQRTRERQADIETDVKDRENGGY